MYRHRWVWLAGWLIAVAIAGYFASGTAQLLSPSGFETDTEASRADDLLRTQFPESKGVDLVVVFDSPVKLTDPAYQAEVKAWSADLKKLMPAGSVLQGPIAGRDGKTTALVVLSSLPPDQYIQLGRSARSIHHAGPATAYVGGFGSVYAAFIDRSESDLQHSEQLSAPIAFVLLLIVFGGVVAGFLPVMTGLASVTVALALLGLVARHHTVSVFALNVSSVVGLGLGIDYSLLVVNRLREEMRRAASVEDAIASTVATAGLATVISGGTVLIGFGALMIARVNVLWSIGLGGVIVVGISVLSTLTLIPALLSVAAPHLDRFALPFTRVDTSRFWHDLAARVTRRPVVFIGLVVVLVTLVALPASGLNLGVVGAESLPASDQSVTADALAKERLGFPQYNPILIVADGVRTPADAAAVERDLKAATTAKVVLSNMKPPYAVWQVTQSAPDNDASTRAQLDRLRAVSWPAGITVRLGGEAPAYQDFLNVLAGDFPKVALLVMAATLVLLGFSFRSVALPIKAVVMNLMSVVAAAGVLTWAFQQGHLSAWLDFRAVGFTDAIIPFILFAALFGISMDYEVFLLSRVREEHLHGVSDAQAVAQGMERTAQIITSAAIILAVVFATLAGSSLALNKGIGVTFAVAIVLDATLIRLLLVPAMMRVLGRANWWPG